MTHHGATDDGVTDDGVTDDGVTHPPPRETEAWGNGMAAAVDDPADWASVPAYRLSASGWERLPAADALEEAMGGMPSGGSPATEATAIHEPLGRAQRALFDHPVTAGERTPEAPRTQRPREAEEDDRGPTVKVKIGRLQVNAAPPSAPAPPLPTVGPRLPLAVYLRRRRAARR